MIFFVFFSIIKVDICFVKLKKYTLTVMKRKILLYDKLLLLQKFFYFWHYSLGSAFLKLIGQLVGFVPIYGKSKKGYSVRRLFLLSAQNRHPFFSSKSNVRGINLSHTSFSFVFLDRKEKKLVFFTHSFHSSLYSTYPM